MKPLLLRLLLKTGPPFYVVIRATRRSSCLQSKTSTLILSYFKNLSIGPVPRINITTFHSAVSLSLCIKWASPAIKMRKVKKEKFDLKTTNRKARQKDRGLKEHYTHILRRWPTFEYLWLLLRVRLSQGMIKFVLKLEPILLLFSPSFEGRSLLFLL